MRFLCTLVLLFLPSLLDGQTPPAPGGSVDPHAAAPVARALPTESPLRIDGQLDEPAWASAPVIDQFTQLDPTEGAPVSQPTEARILYDDEALYIGVRLHDTGPITRRLGRRDMPLGDSDWFGVVLDSYHDHRTGFVFDVNPAGVQRDAVKSMTASGESDDNSWDAVWQVGTSVDEGGWTAEYRIPFSQLRFSPAADQTWGIQLERVIGRNREYAIFSFTPKRERGGIPRYGHLEGLRDVRPGKRLEVLPYTVTRAEYVDPGFNPYRTDTEYDATVGVDVKYRVTSDLTLNATINPDFGQVEIDPAVVNLGVYETFFEEKRPFFIEGSEIFDFGAASVSGGLLFYTRRIGRQPQIRPPAFRADVPEVTNIRGAAKLSGKTSNGWSIGFLDAVTAREVARYLDLDDLDQELVVEPRSNYFVGRLRRDLRAGRSSIGGILTATNRDLELGLARQNLLSGAYASGVDFRHEWANRSWVLSGDLVMSHIRGDPAAVTRVQRFPNHYFQRPDAEHLEVDSLAQSLSGYAAQLALAKQAGEHWQGEVGVAATSPGYEVNDLGFAYRTDRRDVQAAVTYRETQPGDLLRNWYVRVRERYEGNYAGERIANWTFLQASFQTLNYWSGFVNLVHSFQALDDRSTRGGPMILRPANSSAYLHLSTDARKPVTLFAEGSHERSEFGGWETEFGFQVGWRPSPRWNLSIGPELARRHVAEQYITTVDDSLATRTYGKRYVFAPLDQTELSVETRLNLTFTPKLSLEMYAQPFISSADFGAPEELVAPRTYEFQPYTGAEPIPERDFNLRSLRGTAVLRWEWRPGSTLYVAWQQSREDRDRTLGDFDFVRDQEALWEAQPDNIFLIKINYWLNP